MPRTLILLFHPDLARSKANRALAQAARRLDDVEVVDMQALYPDGAIDADVEVRRLLAADRIVLQFPIQWYATPPLLKAWQDLVLTRMFYINYPSEGHLLEGKPLLVAATAGNTEEAYTPQGANLLSLESLLAPLRVSAHRCRLPWEAPFFVYSAGKSDDAALAAAGERYLAYLIRWIRGDTIEPPAVNTKSSAAAPLALTEEGQ